SCPHHGEARRQERRRPGSHRAERRPQHELLGPAWERGHRIGRGARGLRDDSRAAPRTATNNRHGGVAPVDALSARGHCCAASRRPRSAPPAMRLSAPSMGSLRKLGETLLIALAGGGLAQMLGVPVGFLSGSMLFVAAAALAGRPMLVPNAL